jgi:hypothetical protein
MSKFDDKDQDKQEEEDEYDDIKIKHKKGRRTLEKIERKRGELEKRNERIILLDFKLGEETVLSNVAASVSSKVKRGLDLGEAPPKPKRIEREKLTYADLQIETPEEFDYENYDRVNL